MVDCAGDEWACNAARLHTEQDFPSVAKDKFKKIRQSK